MSGHSKWHSIKHKKSITDAKKASAFTKLAKDISVASRDGADPEMNFRLRMAIEKAKSANLPKDNIQRAIEKGAGLSKDGAQIEEVVYEAYGPGQIAMLIKASTDNKNRTLSEIKNILIKNGGKFVEGGAISWQFEKLGVIVGTKKENFSEEEVEMKIIESGAKDYQFEEGEYQIFTQMQEIQKVKETLDEVLEVGQAEPIFLAKNKIEVDEHTRASYEKLLEVLDEQEDVSEIYDNLE